MLGGAVVSTVEDAQLKSKCCLCSLMPALQQKTIWKWPTAFRIFQELSEGVTNKKE